MGWTSPKPWVWRTWSWKSPLPLSRRLRPSVLGLAREVAALLDQPLRHPEVNVLLRRRRPGARPG